MRAIVTIEDVKDGARVVIEYEDGHTVRMSVGPDSPVLRMHLGLDGPEGEPEG
jgi:hypothetical protein